MFDITDFFKKSELLKKSLIFLLIALFALFNFKIYSEFDYRADSGWRNTDISAQTRGYVSGNSFSEPTVEVSRNKFGDAFMETSLPLLPYLASKLVPFFNDGIKSSRGFEVDQNHFIDFGPLKIQNNIPHASLINFTKQELETIDGKKTVVVFEKYKNLIAKLFDRGENGNKFYVAIDSQDCGINFKILLDGKSVKPKCNPNTDNTGPESKEKHADFAAYIWDGIHKIEFISYNNEPLSQDVILYSLAVPGNAIEKANRAVLAFFIAISLFLIYLVFDHFSPKRYVLNFLLIQSITQFYFFFGTFHEEPIAFAFAFGAVLLWTIYKNKNLENEIFTMRDLIGFAILGIAMSLRLYYGIFILFFIFDRIQLILKIRNINSLFELINKNFLKAIGSIALISVPSVLWFSHTQYRTNLGADSIDIFTSRVYFDSLLNVSKWEQLLILIFKFHLPYLTLVGLAILILTKILSKTKMNRMNAVFVLSLTLISIILLPLVFDSAAHHDYYIFPCTITIFLAAVIYGLQHDNSPLYIQSRFWFSEKPFYPAILFRKIALGFLLLSNLVVMNNFLTRSFVLTGDNYDFYIGARYHAVVDRLDTVQPYFIFDNGPQGYHLSGHKGWRPLGTVTPLANSSNGFLYEQKEFKPKFIDNIENSIMSSTNYKIVYWCKQSLGSLTYEDGIIGDHLNSVWAEEYYSKLGWNKFNLNNTCFFYEKAK